MKPIVAAADPTKVRAVFEELVTSNYRMAVLVAVTVITGARRGTIAGLRWRYINLDAGTIDIHRALTIDDAGALIEKDTKTHAAITLHLDPATVALLRRLRIETVEHFLSIGEPFDDDVYVWRQRGRSLRKPIHPDTISHLWRDFADAAGMPGVKYHALRHLVVDTLLEEGRSPYRVADHVTHADPSITLSAYSKRKAFGNVDDAELLGRLLHGS